MQDPPAAADAPPRRRAQLIAAAVVTVVAVVAGLVLAGPDRRAAVGTPAAPQVAPGPSATPTRFQTAVRALDAQAAALASGDESGWLAAVDPARPRLRDEYRTRFRTLRALGLSHAAYSAYFDRYKGATVEVGAYLTYCFSSPACPAWAHSTWDGPPRVLQKLTLEPIDGRYVITTMKPEVLHDELRPTPWEHSDLVVVRGARVTVAATRSQAGQAKTVLAIADRAAVRIDRVAEAFGNPQPRYRIYLADDKAWKSWYGGRQQAWAAGYAIPLNAVGMDVVLRMSKLRDSRRELTSVITHELAHVATIGGYPRDHDETRWLVEGIAEYIGSPPGRDGADRYAARSALRGDTIAARWPGKDPTDRQIDAFYALGHLAADCLADRYGERRLFEFTRLLLRTDTTREQASVLALGEPFARVDRACVAWIKRRA